MSAQTSAARASLMPLDDALAALLAQAQPVPECEPVPLEQAAGRVLAQDLYAALDVPGFDNSAMDGYALRWADAHQALALGRALPVSQRIAAGQAGAALAAGTAARIFTGAPIPAGADSVLAQEDVQVLAPGPDTTAATPGIRFERLPRLGQHIRRRGEDIAHGQRLLPAGSVLDAAHLGLAASVGQAQLPLRRRVRVALLSSGDELVTPGSVAPQALPPGAIYNSNRYFLRALLERLGCTVYDAGHLPDRFDATVAALRAAATGSDLVLSSGGVSVGEEDHFKAALQALGELHLWRLAIKPGKPFAYGRIGSAPAGRSGGAPDSAQPAPQACHCIGLPGNPVASFVTFLLLVRPFVRRLQGVDVQAQSALPQPLHLPAHFDWPAKEPRREFLRVRRNAAGGLDLHPNQGSGVLSSLVWADGLVDNAPGQGIRWGDCVPHWPLSAL